MTYQTILLDVKDEVATLTLNRPERLNAWTTEMAAELSGALSACNERDEVRVVVITGAGRAFYTDRPVRTINARTVPFLRPCLGRE